ncbi:D-glucuronyl C5-epimerase family protein [Paracoccus actinidiae]|uniref:D-glucuronyl C5-epimerase family protein n=1 Tax=Paracoccus actinidiae TaxID=3064531 RepID=UPI0027D27C5B|nr:D-glucuronyl C5-epimerase family protein [Paracoccus sp. M09]
MKDFDSRHSVPIIRALSITSSYPIYKSYSYRLRVGSEVSRENLPIDALLVPGEAGSKKLIVAFHGAINRREIEIPRYEWLGQLAGRDEHKLFISDTTLELSHDLNLAWYLGTPHCNLISKIAKFINHVRHVNEINEIVLMGSSGGGFAAMAIGAGLNGSCSIAFSPQSNIWDFTEAHSKKFKESVFLNDDWDACQKEMDNRTDLIKYYSEGRHLNHYIYYQNTGDVDHVKKHWKRFSESQGVRLQNGRSFNQQGLFISDFDADGHSRPPIKRMDELINLSFDMAKKRINLIEDSCASGSIYDYKFQIDMEAIDHVPSNWLFYYSSYKASLPAPSSTIDYTQGGVPLRVISDIAYDHPVLQAQIALKLLNNINNSKLSDNDRNHAAEHARATLLHLDKYAVSFRSAKYFPFGFSWHQDNLQPPWYSAMAQGQVLHTLLHLDKYAVSFRSAKYFPFGFSWHQDNLQPPWYSAMAQGQVLQLACRYTELTGSDEFRAFAERVFQSFLYLRSFSSKDIGVIHIDSSGYLWLEEYPYPEHNKFVLNGHIFAALGVFEYWRLTKSEAARRVFCGALSTVRRYISEFRNPSWSSHYDLRSRLLIRNYHSTHISLLEHLYILTGDSFFSRSADILEEDFPHYQGGGLMIINPGKHTGVKADNTRVPTKIMHRLDFDVTSPITIPFAARTKMETESGVWLYVEDEGPYKGLWFKEKAQEIYPFGQIDRRNYNRPRSLLPTKSFLTINGFNEEGVPSNHTVVQTNPGSRYEVLGKALWNGVWYALLKTEHPVSVSWHEMSSEDAILV